MPCLRSLSEDNDIPFQLLTQLLQPSSYASSGPHVYFAISTPPTAPIALLMSCWPV